MDEIPVHRILKTDREGQNMVRKATDKGLLEQEGVKLTSSGVLKDKRDLWTGFEDEDTE